MSKLSRSRIVANLIKRGRPTIRKPIRTVKRPTTDQLDPSRTLTLRRSFIDRLAKQFDALKVRIVRFVGKENGLGLANKQVQNCAPGQMRGADGKCGPGIGLGIDRKHMPQIKTDDMDEFLLFVESNGVKVERESVKSGQISPTQSEFRQERVDSLSDHVVHQPILVSADDYILDGTHRWVKRWQTDKNEAYPIVRIMLGVHDALALMRSFNKAKFVNNTSVLNDPRTLSWEERQQLVGNAFCPTGPGGGIDPTCPPHKSLMTGKHYHIAHWLGQQGYSHDDTKKVLELLGHKASDQMIRFQHTTAPKRTVTFSKDEVQHLHDLAKKDKKDDVKRVKEEATKPKPEKPPAAPKAEKPAPQPKPSATPPKISEYTGPVPKEKPNAGQRERGDASAKGGKGAEAAPAKSGGQVEATPERTSPSGTDRGGKDGDQPAGKAAATRVPADRIDVADKQEVIAKLDQHERTFREQGDHDMANLMAMMKDHVDKVGTEQALKELGEEASHERGGKGEAVQYAGVVDIGHFAEAYLDRNGISIAHDSKYDPSKKVVSAVAPSSDAEGFKSRGQARDVFPKLQGLKDKLEEAKHLPGLEKSEDLSVIMGGKRGEGVSHLTPEVISNLNAKYGKDGWIVKSYGEEAFAGFGIYFPQRAAAIHEDANNTLWSAKQEIGKYGFDHLREGDNPEGKIIGIKHVGGDEYKFGTEKYNQVIGGDVRHWADKSAAVADHERGAALPKNEEGKLVKEFMAQPAFQVVGVSDADRASGKTWEGNREGRVHIFTKDGVAQAIPHSTWIKGDNLPVVFEDKDTRAMAKAAVDAINALPKSERQGQVYAPDIVRSKDGFKAVEANPSNEAGGSGYMQDNPFIIDAYVSHVTGREPAHVKFIRDVLTKHEREVGELATHANPNHDELGRFTGKMPFPQAHEPVIDTLSHRQVRNAGTTDETLPLSSLHASQKGMLPKHFRWASKNRDPILVVRINNKNVILDGHHRAAVRLDAGETHIKAQVFDYDKRKDEIDQDLRFNALHKFSSSFNKLEEFQRWLDSQLDDTLRSRSEEDLWNAYIQQGFHKGAGRSFDDVRGKSKPIGPNRTARPRSKRQKDQQDHVQRQVRDIADRASFQGGKDEFLRSTFAKPVAVEKVQLLTSRTFDDLEGMTEDMATKLSRTLADGLVEGKSPHEVARDMTEVIDVSRSRAETIARTELIRAHSEGQLTALENLGVKELGVAVEWTNSGLNTVDKKGRPISPCNRCKALSGVILKIEEAHNLIPVHPNCTCAFVPTNVGEDDDAPDRKDTKEEIDSALEDAGVEGVDIDEDRPASILTDNAPLDAFSEFMFEEG